MHTMRSRTRRSGGAPATGSRLRVTVSLTVALVLGTIGFLAAGALAGNARQSSATISLRSTSLGSILVDSKGRTLYLFMKDRRGKSSCGGMCATYWPPLVTKGRPTVGSGLKASLVGTSRRSNGAMQVTYNKHPLYMFVQDAKPGQTKGQGLSFFGGRWFAVSAKGTAVVKAAGSGGSTSTSTTTTTTPYPDSPYP